ncbi:MAG: hypothetical protein COX48_05900 [bacterium (Candidatus Stahlbacteria) CG23_combo_of_CG06-09_8_20_14_all_34_7]|nr:MAG: hypothetical protein COX48_05900 [bacterium (Candidatus Stahlbacteria) CG23_combo_of_CG06-09_8_20_14_all_34_7]
MRFFSNEYLILLYLLPIVFIILLFLKRLKEDAEYPFTKIFTAKKKEKRFFRSFIMKIIRILLVTSILANAILSLSKPYIKSNRIEHLALFIDKTPYMNYEIDKVNRFIDSLGGKEAFRNIHIYINQKKVKYPLKENDEIKPNLIEKQRVMEHISRTIFSYKSNSVKSILLTDRSFKRINLETDIIVRRDAPKVLITGIGRFIFLYSKDEVVVELTFKLKDKNIGKLTVNLKKGINKINSPVKEFDFVNCLYDSIKLGRGILLSRTNVNEKTGNKFVLSAIKSLDANLEENSDIEISYNNNIKKGIVFSKEDEKYTAKSELFSTDKNFDEYIRNMNKNLEYTSLYKIKGEPIIISKKGEIILSNKDDVYFVALPLDTSKSNFVITPSFVLLMDQMLNRFTGKSSEIVNKELNYRKELTQPYSDYLSGYETPKELDISFVFTFVSLIFLMILIFT